MADHVGLPDPLRAEHFREVPRVVGDAQPAAQIPASAVSGAVGAHDAEAGQQPGERCEPVDAEGGVDEQHRVAFPLVPEGDVRVRCEEVV
ncbi:hypothetical protein ABZ461_24015 [Actinacidiphila glaucinigra]|uniref:hypothetical protein n=1 Tax=Actinacidiphila glaucinigra TaxID=235986 RepID=UPI0033D111F6